MSSSFHRFDSSEPITEIDYSRKKIDEVSSKEPKFVARLSSDIPTPVNTEYDFTSFVDNLSDNVEVVKPSNKSDSESSTQRQL